VKRDRTFGNVSFSPGLAGDAQTRPRNRIQTPGGDRLFTLFAQSVGAFLDLGQSRLNIVHGAGLSIELADYDLAVKAGPDLIQRIGRMLNLKLIELAALGE